MRSRHECRLAVALPFLLAMSAPTALARPSLDESVDVLGLFSGTADPARMLLVDDKDASIAYVPPRRLEFVVEDGLPSFALSYTKDGLVFAGTVAVAKESHTHGRSLRPLPLDEGRFVLSVSPDERTVDPSGITVGSGRHGDSFSFQVSIPRGALADLVMLSLRTGAGAGLNYIYEYTAGVTPFRIRYEIAPGASLALSDRHGATTATLADDLRGLRDRGDLVVVSSGPVGTDIELFPLAQWLFDTCQPTWKRGFLAGSSSCSLEGAPLESSIATTFRGTGSAGLSIGSLCDSHPELFIHESADGTLVPGCADSIL